MTWKFLVYFPQGREQAELTGLRLASLGLKFNKIVHSSMTRAVETTDIISKHLPGVCKVSTDLLREGAPIEPDPPVSDWKPEAVVKKKTVTVVFLLGGFPNSTLAASFSPCSSTCGLCAACILKVFTLPPAVLRRWSPD